MALFKGGAPSFPSKLQCCIEIHSQIFSDIGFVFQFGLGTANVYYDTRLSYPFGARLKPHLIHDTAW